MGHENDGIQSKPVDAPIEPEGADFEPSRNDCGIPQIELRLRGQEMMQIKYCRRRASQLQADSQRNRAVRWFLPGHRCCRESCADKCDRARLPAATCQV